MINRGDWSAEIEQLHSTAPGVTAEILKSALCRKQNPYEWLIDGVASADVVVDLGCGNGPTESLIAGRWIGIDRSIVELEAAAAATSGALIQGIFEHLPIRQRSVDTVVCSMSLMLAVDLEAALNEILRVLRPGGSLRLLLPTTRSLTGRDRLRYWRLQLALGLSSYFPSSPLLDEPATLLAQFGFTIVSDLHTRFCYDIATEHHAERLIRSLYLPGVDATRREGAINLARRWRGSTLGLPLRRIVATAPLGT